MATLPSYMEHQNNNSGCFQRCISAGGDGKTPSPTLTFLPFANRNHSNPDHQEMKPSEDFLAAELSKLSVQERSIALDDLHCVGQELKDTPEIIDNALFELDQILKERNEPIYQIALNQNRAFVEDVYFRLRFLRANHHDATKAANQMIGFLKQKEIYFGRDKLARDITLEDLDEEDKQVLLSGRFHIQNAVDRNGRVVVYCLNHGLHLANDSMIRANYVVFYNILSSLPSVQTKGVAVVTYDLSKPGSPVPSVPTISFMRKFFQFVRTVPVRRTGIHFCFKANCGALQYHNQVMENVLRWLQQSARVRVRMHYGSDLELHYKLQSHGLPMENMPVNTNGEIRMDILNVWFEEHVKKQSKQKGSVMPQSQGSVMPQHQSTVLLSDDFVLGDESIDNGDLLLEDWDLDLGGGGGDDDEAPTMESLLFATANINIPWSNTNQERNASPPTQSTTTITTTASTTASCNIEPTDKDVLLGRGRTTQMHPGNVRFRQFLESYQEQYNNTPRYKRVDTAREITLLLSRDGVRFLQRTEDGIGWVEASVAEAEKKVKQLFRSRKKTKNKSN